MRLLLQVVVILLLPAAAYADLTFEQLQNISATPESLDGHFTQEKYLSALDTVLLSSGVFNYQRDVSIRWQTLKPIQNELLMTPTSISNKQADQELMRIEKESNPVVALFNEIFFSVLTAQWKKLSAHFMLTGEIQDGHWHASLVPVDKTVKQVVSRVELKGDVLVREIILHESGGDRTTIHFENLKP
ncbi:MAG: outer membrane lipoprotein carrier protein LolA [Gammaproteobacteria bacterium]|nr:outer membrane lipoprotein carrier protein LolA [Gammaproteobacteria bacterium]